MRKCGRGLSLRLTSKADTYAIAYIDCILNLKGENVDQQFEEAIDRLWPEHPDGPRNCIVAC